MTANVHAVDLGAGAIFSLQLTGLSIGEADFFKSLAGTITRDRIELPQHSNHEVILDAAMQLCDKFGKDDPEYTTAAVRLAALALRIAVEGDEAFDKPVSTGEAKRGWRGAGICHHTFEAVPRTGKPNTDYVGQCIFCGYVPV